MHDYALLNRIMFLFRQCNYSLSRTISLNNVTCSYSDEVLRVIEKNSQTDVYIYYTT